jgi:hypothetical protein
MQGSRSKFTRNFYVQSSIFGNIIGFLQEFSYVSIRFSNMKELEGQLQLVYNVQYVVIVTKVYISPYMLLCPVIK